MSNANQSVVQRAYKCFEHGDIDGLLDTLTDDVSWKVVGPAEVFPLFGERRGRDGAAEYFRLFAENLDLRDFSPRRYVAQDDTVVVLGHSKGVVRHTGRPLESDWVHVFTLRDGKICGYQEFVDSAKVVESQLAA